jgi:hypothetical protein
MNLKETCDKMFIDGTIAAETNDMMQKIAAGPMGEAVGALFAGASKPLINTIMALGIGAAAKEMIVDPILSSMRIQDSYNNMRSVTPQLAGKTDKEIVDYFNVVKTFSPKAASNPLVAGALVNKMLEFGGVDHKLVQDPYRQWHQSCG